MSVFRRTPARSSLALAAAVIVLAVGAASVASASGGNGATGSTGSPGMSGATVGSSRTTSASTGVATAPAGIVSSTSAVAPYPWCCSTAPGISATGQATVHGSGSTARDEAIARAVADATDQARTAATAAGVGLGPVIDLQVSSPPIVYPLIMGSSSGTSGPSTSIPAPMVTFASVTITFAIA